MSDIVNPEQSSVESARPWEDCPTCLFTGFDRQSGVQVPALGGSQLPAAACDRAAEMGEDE